MIRRLKRSMQTRGLAAIRRQIRKEWADIAQRADVAGEPKLPASPTLLGESTKVNKGRASGIATAVIYMAPDGEAFREGDGRTLCPWASESCSRACLGHSTGRLVMDSSRNARLWKTALYLGSRALWRELLVAESIAFQRTAIKAGYLPAVRVDGATDTGEGAILARSIPSLQVYDYTKSLRRAIAHAEGTLAPNYHITFSYSGENETECRSVLRAGGNVAVVFDRNPRTHEALPESWNGAQVLDGDVHDARFLDPTGGYVLGLRFKAAKDWAGSMERAGSFVASAGELIQIAAA